MDKTCGNCGYGERQAISCSKRKMLFIPRKPGCDKWIEQTDTLEQRYQQLAQVVKDMWNWVVYEHNTRRDFPGVDMSGFIDRLEVLGVSVDG